MKKAFCFIGSLLLIITSCSSEDPPEEITIPAFTVIGASDGIYYESSFDPSRNQTNLINLSDQLGLDISNLLSLNFTENIVSFNNRNVNEISAWQKDLNTGASRKYDSYFTIEEDQFLIWNTHSKRHIYIGYESPFASGDVYIRIIDRENETVRDTYLTTVSRATLLGEPMYYSNKLLVTFSNEGVYQTIVFNTNTQQIDDRIIYEGAPHVLKNTDGNLSIFDLNNTYFEYDLVALSKLNERTLSTIPPFLRFGNLPEPIVHNNIIYHKYPAAQPSFLDFYPGIFDINSQKSTIIDVNQDTNIPFEPIQGTRFVPLTLVYDIANEVFLVGFTANYPDGAKGVMIFNKNRQLINAIELPFSPIKILLQ
ncbi:hypothetical protein ACJD0Z_01440 [Flavobacteriaceae bacterium M23B6Z8]